MTVGLKEDMMIKTEKIMLYRFNDVFFPENSYYNSDPLPIEWIEVFEEAQTFMKDDTSTVWLETVTASPSKIVAPIEVIEKVEINGMDPDDIKQTMQIFSEISTVLKDKLI